MRVARQQHQQQQAPIAISAAATEAGDDDAACQQVLRINLSAESNCCRPPPVRHVFCGHHALAHYKRWFLSAVWVLSLLLCVPPWVVLGAPAHSPVKGFVGDGTVSQEEFTNIRYMVLLYIEKTPTGFLL